jgi:hypothetical protein
MAARRFPGGRPLSLTQATFNRELIMKTLQPRLSILRFGLPALLAATTAHADTITQTMDNIDWNAAMWGTPAAAPTPGNDYVTALVGTNRFRISADGTSSTFAGDSLTVATGTRALMKNTDGTTATIGGNLTMDGGLLSLAANSVGSATLDVSQFIVTTNGAHIDVANNGMTLTIAGTLTGPGDILIDYESGTNAGTRAISFADINAYTGAITVNDQMDIDFGADYIFSNFLDLSSGSVLNVDQTLTFDEGDLIDAVNGAVAAGTYSGAGLTALGANYADGGGTIIVTGTVVDTDGDGLPDSYEDRIIDFDPGDAVTDYSHVLGPNNAPATTDFDSDGATDADEFANNTDPTDDDSDDDGLLDGVETDTRTFVDANDTGSNPLDADTDDDGFGDGVEVRYGFDPNLAGGVNTPGDATPFVNGGFETPPVAVSGEGIAVSGGTVTGWSTVENDFYVTDVLPPTSGDPSGPSEGAQFATANRMAPIPVVDPGDLVGGDAATMSMRQDIDVSALAAGIDAGTRSLLVDFDWFERDTGDTGIVTLRFLDASDQDLGRRSIFRTSGASGTWTTTRQGGYPPAGTRTVRVTLEGVAQTEGGAIGAGTARNVAFDNFQARLVYFDKDEDEMADDWENTHGLDPDEPADAADDGDSDNLDNLEEFNLGTNPTLADTDGDGFDDDVEVTAGTDPLDPASHPASQIAVVAAGFNEFGEFEVTYSGLNTSQTYVLKRGTDLQSFPDVVDTYQPIDETDTFLDVAPPAGKAFYKLEEQ